jgi:Uma2 family endonuclease
MVISGEPAYHGKGNTIVINPTSIVEVLSKSTRSYDRTDKFDQYRSLKTMQEYCLLEQTERKAYQYVKTELGQCLFTEYRENETLILISLNLTLTISELYEGIDFIQTEE